MGQGRENVRRFLAEHPDVMKNISDRVKEKLGLGEKKDISEEAH